MSKHNLLLDLTKEEYYKQILESVSEDEKEEFILYIENIARQMETVCKKFEDIVSTPENLEILINELGDSINRSAFKGNIGAEGALWPITKKD
tara:strand:+ start:761 stop:1039 length:279 start_codon:yes stop_codon:yes gene_type:complete